MIQRASASTETHVPLVIKFGGSLFKRAPKLAHILVSSPVPSLVVPGGGPFADLVRETGADEDAAHWMAIAGMEQYGHYLSSFGLTSNDELEIPKCPTVFLPYTCMRACDPLPHSWDVTSDTIAAWVAHQLDLDLLVLKSVDGIIVDGEPVEIVDKPVLSDTIDPHFIRYVLENSVKTTIINGSSPNRVKDFLVGKPVLGTLIGTTF